MRRSLRTLFAVVSAGLGVLAIGVVALWVVTRVAPGKYILKSRGVVGDEVRIVGWAFVLDSGSVWCLRQPTRYSIGDADALTRDGALYEGWRFEPGYAGQNRSLTRPFAFRIGPGGGVPRFGVIFTPLWIPFVACCVLPTIWVGVWSFRRRQVAAGSCSVCGYDLRESPARCPECGTIRPPPPR